MPVKTLKDGFGPSELKVLTDALICYGGEIKKLLKKAESLGLSEAKELKQTFLLVSAVHSKVEETEN